MANKTNSFPNTAEQLIRMHQNNAEVIAKLDQALTSDQSHVQIETVDIKDGTVSTTEIQTVGNLHSRLARMEENFKTLAGLNGNATAVYAANNSYKRIVLADVNLEPNDISALQAVNTFRTDKNWIFDSLMNPSMSVEFDLTEKVQNAVRKVVSRRFMVKFSKDQDGNLTADGAARLLDFNTKYKGQSNIDILEFISWYQNNPGIQYRNDPLLDEQVFDLLPHRLKYNGTFSVLGTEVDTLNKKIWYKLNTLNYQDVSNTNAAPVIKTLAIGDDVAVVPNFADQASTTVYTVVEISTVTSDYRVRFELKTGQDPIPSRINALKIYSEVVYNKSVRITIGFDEYNVIFVRPLHAENHLLSQNWSKGTGFYTNDLRLNTPTGKNLKEFYVNQVYDYGAVLQDLVARKVPVDQGIQPVPPNIVKDNFKVVQINKHLTDTVDAEKIRELNQQLNTYKSEVAALQTAVQDKQKLIGNRRYISDADRNADNAELNQLVEQYKSRNELVASILKKILQQKKNINSVAPKFKLRGFWSIPDAIQSAGTAPQEVVQFEVQYRYSSNSGSTPQMEQFQVDAPLDAASFIAANRESSKDIAAQAKSSKLAKVNATFSNWNKYLTDKRTQVKDPVTNVYKWSVEDVSSADTPNINQLDISLNPGETVEVRIRSLSEVGWPEAPLTSEWSELLEVAFPDDLNSVLNEDDFILQEATQEDQRVKLVKELAAKGLDQHLASSYTSDDKYYAHRAEDIASGTLDANGKMLSLYAYLNDLKKQMDGLREIINRSKGELRVRFFQGSQEQVIGNNGEINLSIDLEDSAEEARIGTTSSYVTSENRRTYRNGIYNLSNCYIVIDNAAVENPLGILSNRVYSSAPGVPSTPFAFDYAKAQALWVNNSDEMQYYGARSQTQKDYQWLYLQNTRTDGSPIYSWGGTDPEETIAPSLIYNAVTSPAFNYGVAPSCDDDTPNISIVQPAAWETDSGTLPTGLAASVHPRVNQLTDLTELGNDKTKTIVSGAPGEVKIPISLYWKFHTQRFPANYFGGGALPSMVFSVSNSVLVASVDAADGAKFETGDEFMLTGISNNTDVNNKLIKITYKDPVLVGGRTMLYTDFITVVAPGNGTGIEPMYIGKRFEVPSSNGAEVFTPFVRQTDSPASSSVFRLSSSNGTPQTIKRSLRFYMEPVTLTRPFQFTINFTLRQFRPISLTR